MIKIFIGLLCLLFVQHAHPQQITDLHIKFNSKQLIVVTTAGWDAKTGKLTAYTLKNNKWVAVLNDMKIVTGWSGLAWGEGLHSKKYNQGKIKKEGDGNSPAGIFPLVSLYGYGKTPGTSLPYLQVTKANFCIDDPASGYYNQIVKADTVKKDWKSAEKMHLSNDQYKYGIMVGYNTAPVKPGAGSCIFIHIWNDDKTSTSGCTAMTENDIVKLINFLDHASKPLLVQLPQKEYNRLRGLYKLP